MRVDSSEQNLGKMTLAVHRSSIIKARVEAPAPFQARGQHTQAPLFLVSIVFVLFTLYGVHIYFLARVHCSADHRQKGWYRLA